MPDKKNKLDKKVNQIISDLQNLDTSEFSDTDLGKKGILNFSDILSNLDDNPESAIGTEIGQWTILGLLGIGGMSIVYLVERNDKSLKQKAALKIIPNAIASKNMIERFIRERQILSDLNHHNIAKLYDAGITENNIPWLVMELVEGEDILSFADKHNLNLEQRVVLFKQICKALAYAHANGVIHRDIKPSNLMVNDEKVLKLLDFGIASVEEQQSLTMTGAIIGTPGYMSPEQAKGISSELDRRTDIFSLGVLLYKLIKHEMPFRAENISEISYKIIHDEPTLLGSGTPIELQAIIFKCLEKKVDNRYSSVSALNQDLNSYLNGDVVSARKVTFLRRLIKKIIKHPIISALIIIATLTSLMGVGFGVYQAYASLKKIQVAENHLHRSQEIKAKARRMHMMPAHNIQSEYTSISNEIEQLKSEIESTDIDTSGLSDFALGSAYLTMRKNDLAYDYLLKAENKGWQSPELSSALGQILVLKWEKIKEHSLSISDKNKKQKYLNKQKVAVYQPAILYLKQAQKGLSTSNYISSYLAYLEDDTDKAIEFIEKENTINPWHYEAFAFASNLYIIKAIPILNSQGYQQAEIYLKQSKLKMDQAINIGRSDPNNYIEYCANFGFEIQLQLEYHTNNIDEVFNQGLNICKNALKITPPPKDPSIFRNLNYLYDNYADYQTRLKLSSIEFSRKAYEATLQGLALHPNDSGLLTASASPIIAMAQYNISNNKDPDQYYQIAITNLEKSLSINPNQRKSWHQLATLHKDLGNYYRDKQNQQQADFHYQQSILNHKKVIDLGNKLSGLANSALVYNEWAKLKSSIGKPNEGIKLIKQAMTTSEEILQFNTDVYIIYVNYFEYQFELVKVLDTHDMPYSTELSNAIESINNSCSFDYLNKNHFKMLKPVLNFYYDNNYATPQDFNTCQSKKEALEKN